jgi:hypothetical protein
MPVRSARATSERVAPLLLVAIALACGGRSGLDVPAPEAGIPAVDAPPASVDAVCGPSNCPGCCDDAGVCQPGNTEAQCGEQGRACIACNPKFDLCAPDPANPDGQVCFSPCDFKGCNYHCCLRTGACTSGVTDDACGSTGQLCVDCTTTGQVCDVVDFPHVCVNK